VTSSGRHIATSAKSELPPTPDVATSTPLTAVATKSKRSTVTIAVASRRKRRAPASR
jgi:hypothetical protein